MLSDDLNERLVRVVLVISKIVKDWHSEQARSLRSCDGALTWICDQTNGHKFMDHIEAMIAQLNSRAAMESCSFVCSEQVLCLFCSFVVDMCFFLC